MFELILVGIVLNGIILGLVGFGYGWSVAVEIQMDLLNSILRLTGNVERCERWGKWGHVAVIAAIIIAMLFLPLEGTPLEWQGGAGRYTLTAFIRLSLGALVGFIVSTSLLGWLMMGLFIATLAGVVYFIIIPVFHALGWIWAH